MESVKHNEISQQLFETTKSIGAQSFSCPDAGDSHRFPTSVRPSDMLQHRAR